MHYIVVTSISVWLEWVDIKWVYFVIVEKVFGTILICSCHFQTFRWTHTWIRCCVSLAAYECSECSFSSFLIDLTFFFNLVYIFCHIKGNITDKFHVLDHNFKFHNTIKCLSVVPLFKKYPNRSLMLMCLLHLALHCGNLVIACHKALVCNINCKCNLCIDSVFNKDETLLHSLF